MMHKKPLFIALLIANNIAFASDKPAVTTDAESKTFKPLPIKPPLMQTEDATEVNIIVEKNRTIEEYRQRGELILVKVIPNKGKPYYIDPLENRRQGSAKELMNAGVKPVHWVVKEF